MDNNACNQICLKANLSTHATRLLADECLPRKDVFVTLPGVSVVLANLRELANEVNGGNGRIKKCLSEKL